jgi:DNA replication protein DnaC
MRPNELTAANAAASWNRGRSLLFSGGAGRGKSYLARGFVGSSLNMVPCTRIVEAYADCGRAGVLDILHGVFCLDDLGQEVPHFGREVVVDVICERERNGSQTVITTNLSMDEIEKRYGERTSSRLYGWCDIYLFDGPDLRRTGVPVDDGDATPPVVVPSPPSWRAN